MSKYSEEFKLEVVQYYLKNGGYGTTADKFGNPNQNKHQLQQLQKTIKILAKYVTSK